MKNTANLAWIDIEMTGLEPQSDVILEIASIITDSDLRILEEGPSLIIHQPEAKLYNMKEWVKLTHESSGLIEKVKKSKVSVCEAEEKTLEFINKFCVSSITPLCGNSIWNDRIFLKEYMPKLNDFFHYRNIDVSTIKELVKRWYGSEVEFKKNKAHRALEDIKESINELKYYRDRFFVQGQQ
ncbi:oligoribonuclease [candidate division TM6 bacterium RIFCSPHIGHO2_12_FULL_32_22]|nr:MAG: oligoribonuclease [candidate division TM6 bacterium RIFCSPHIGHO2_12_FULL_32_22]